MSGVFSSSLSFEFGEVGNITVNTVFLVEVSLNDHVSDSHYKYDRSGHD